jgi:hypothetical protein
MEEVATPLNGAAHSDGPRTEWNGNAPNVAVSAPLDAPLGFPVYVESADAQPALLGAIL